MTTLGLTSRGGPETTPDTTTAHTFDFTSIDGHPLPLSRFAGQTLLVVNTASQCGFTCQYAGLQELWESYRDRGLVVLGVPSDDFGGQEPGDETQIREFSASRYNVTFPLTVKTRVTGNEAHPFYRWARAQVGLLGSPKWNFHKYLIGPDGRLVTWFSSITGPNAGRLVAAVDDLLPEWSD
ncbi:glutathione peroxidase [uncultured Rhodospira sp.]|uniref:glutathione peroxidase n=1 Tax=uncultured Rhodospira sp. TaxID=1936189 RepID=UPI00261BFFF0|nr:glutathione peroxidase [uncultured Rhodospira sp.]